MKIPFNKPYLAGREKEYVLAAIDSGFAKGGGPFARKCHALLEKRYGFKKCLLATSCTDALEMAAILTGVGPGDEVIAAFLYGQLERIDEIQAMRVAAWNEYREALAPLTEKELFEIQGIPSCATNNAHMFYLRYLA